MSDWFGGAAGAASGALSGAAAGSVISPGIGTIAGAAIGGLASLVGGMGSNAQTAQSNREANLTSLMMQNNAAAFNEDEAIRNRIFQQDQQTRANQFSRESQDQQQAFQTGTMATAMDYGTRERMAAQQYGSLERMAAQDYNTLMSNTAWQRGVADMRAAGINPILAYSQGGASSPSAQPAQSRGASVSPMSGSAPSGAGGGGAQGSISGGQGTSTRFENALGQAVSTALQAMGVFRENERFESSVANTNAHTSLMSAEASKVRAETEGRTVATGLDVARTKTESGRPGEINAHIDALVKSLEVSQAQVGQLGAAAGLSSAQAATARATEEKLRKEIEVIQNELNRFKEFGPKTHVGDIAAGVESFGSHLLSKLPSTDPRAVTDPAKDVTGFLRGVTGSARRLLDYFR